MSHFPSVRLPARLVIARWLLTRWRHLPLKQGNHLSGNVDAARGRHGPPAGDCVDFKDKQLPICRREQVDARYHRAGRLGGPSRQVQHAGAWLQRLCRSTQGDVGPPVIAAAADGKRPVPHHENAEVAVWMVNKRLHVDRPLCVLPCEKRRKLGSRADSLKPSPPRTKQRLGHHVTAELFPAVANRFSLLGTTVCGTGRPWSTSRAVVRYLSIAISRLRAGFTTRWPAASSRATAFMRKTTSSKPPRGMPRMTKAPRAAVTAGESLSSLLVICDASVVHGTADTAWPRARPALARSERCQPCGSPISRSCRAGLAIGSGLARLKPKGLADQADLKLAKPQAVSCLRIEKIDHRWSEDRRINRVEIATSGLKQGGKRLAMIG